VRTLRLARILTGAFLLTSCSLEVPDDVGSLVLYMDIDKGTLLLDETLTVTVTARNVGYEPLTLTGPSDCLIYIEVRDPQGLIIHSSNDSCSGSTVTEEMAAGADKVAVFTWNGMTSAGSRAASGLYGIRATARVTGNPYRGPPVTVAVE
jgi:hypothetical protein